MKRTLLIVGIALLVLSAVLLIGGLIQFIIPPTFESVARIASQPEATDVKFPNLDPSWIQTQVETLQSRMVLYQVITNLDLNRKWGEKFKEGALPTDLSYKLLKSQIHVRPGRGAALIEIHVRNDDPTEASVIANKIAEVYRVQRTFHANEIREKNESTMIKDGIVDIVDQAEPDFRPVKPHPLMKILVPVAGLLAGVFGVVLLMLAVMKKGGAKKSPPPLPV